MFNWKVNKKFYIKASFFSFQVKSNLYKMTTLGTTEKWLSRAGGCLIKQVSI